MQKHILCLLTLSLVSAQTGAASSAMVSRIEKLASIGWAATPAISPDHGKIAYISKQTGIPQVWVWDSQSGSARQATTFDSPVTGLRWSPQDDTLAVSVSPGGGLNSQIFLVSLAERTPRQITAGGRTNNWLGDWSPDARFIALSSNVKDAATIST